VVCGVWCGCEVCGVGVRCEVCGVVCSGVWWCVVCGVGDSRTDSPLFPLGLLK
jgi:hypothetical protein